MFDFYPGLPLLSWKIYASVQASRHYLRRLQQLVLQISVLWRSKFDLNRKTTSIERPQENHRKTTGKPHHRKTAKGLTVKSRECWRRLIYVYQLVCLGMYNYVYMGFHYPFMILAVIVVSEDGSSEQEWSCGSLGACCVAALPDGVGKYLYRVGLL